MKTLLSRKLSLVFLIVQFLISAALVGVAFYVGFIPLKYIVALIVLCLFLLAYEVFSQMTDKTYIVGRVLCALICFFYIGGGYYCVNTYSAIDEMAGQQVKVDEISCIVLKDDPAQSIYDTKDYTFGILAANDRENTNKALAEVQAAIGKEPATIEYQDNDTLIDALYAKDVKVIVINEANRSPIEEYYKTFSDDTRVLNTHKVETVIQEDEKLDDITKTPFNVYLSGIDVYGSIKATSRSDVNVIVTVNPNTKQILLTSTPRDYYVPLTVSNGIPDKLTHAGNYGVEASIDTLQNLYGIDIDYYVKINFTGCVSVVDALGGITIDSEVEFTCGEDASPIPYHFVKGPNECDGEMAVAFSRERHAFAAGDFQRGRNQTAAIKGILQKATSPAILTKYSAVLDAVSDMFLTNIPTSTISDLVKLQLSDSTAWNIQTYSIEGSTQPPAGQGPAYLEITGLRGASVVYPYADSINTAIQLMSKIQNGDVFDVDEYVDSLNNNSN